LLAIDHDIDGSTSEAAANTELVFGIYGERVLDQHAAASSQRQAFNVTLLRKSTGRVVRHLTRDQSAIADCATADLHCPGTAALNECRRRSECIGNIVKTLGCIVRRQQRPNIDIKR